MIVIRPAREADFDAVARVWLASWNSIGLPASPGDASLEQLRARLPQEIAKGWSLFVAEHDGVVAAMLAIHVPDKHLDQLFVAPDYQRHGIGKQLLARAREMMPDEIWLRTAAGNTRAIAWYEREGFVRERMEPHAATGRPMAYYRWKKAKA